MKTLFFSNSLKIVGGAEDYAIRKTKKLSNMGHDVYLIAPEISEDYENLLKLNQVKYLKSVYLSVSPQFYSSKASDKIVCEIIDNFSNVKFDFIESHQVYPMLWAELLSQKLGIPNFVYILNESGNYASYYKRFLTNKIEYNEVIGCNSMTLPILNKKLNMPSYKNSYINISIDVDELVNNNFDLVNNEEFVITTIARLDKYYIKNLMTDVYNISLLCQSPKILLVIIGKGLHEREFKQFATDIQNEKLRIVFTGTIKPLSKNIFMKTDIFVGMGTTTLLSSSCNCATLVADPTSNQSTGYLGIHTNNFAYAQDNDKVLSFYHYILELLHNKELKESYSNAAKSCYLREFENDNVTQKYLKIISNGIDDFQKTSRELENIKSNHYVENIRWLLFKILGLSNYHKFNDIIVKTKVRLFKNDF